MHKFYILTFTLLVSVVSQAQTPCVDGMAGQFPCKLVDLMSFVPLEDMGNGDNTNDIWGWVSPNTAREYALVGCSNGTSFVDVTDPLSPVVIGFLSTHTVPSLWRDVKVYDHYCFIVSEAPGHGMQVFDLLQLDEVVETPADFEETAHYDGFGNAHNIAINPESSFAYCIGSNTFSGGLHIVNIADPLNPTLAGGFSADGYTHDCQMVYYSGPDNDYSGKEIVVACNEDEVTVVDVTDKSDCELISATGYENDGYTHQGWFAKGMRYFLFDDELDEMEIGGGTKTHIMDMQDLDNPQYMGFYESTSPSIDHNLYALDQLIFLSNYRSGLRILDASRVSESLMYEVGFFDLYPLNDNVQFSGSWSNYCYFPSGNVVATDMYSGLFVVRPNLFNFSENNWSLCGDDEVTFTLDVNADLVSSVNVGIEGFDGNVTISNPGTLSAPFETSLTISGLVSLEPGTHSGKLVLNTTFGTQYEFPLDFSISTGAPETVSNMSPMIGANLLTTNDIVFFWSEQNIVESYTFQLATDADFTNIVDEEVVLTSSYDYPSNLPEGVYFWRVKGHNECGEGPFSDPTSFNVIVVSVNENQKGDFLVYPNPTNDIINVVSENRMITFTIYDMLGKKVDQFNNQGKNVMSCNVANLESGMYTIESNDGSRTTFVVK
jgi:choice-of-anchor B domain-containing protein